MCVLESLYKVGLLPCSVHGLWGRMCPLGCGHFVAEVSRYQLQVCVARSKISQGVMLIVNVLEDKLDAVVF